ncbi:MAG: penicillin-binding transpeptidase domain-containing protein, partial [Bacillota bacterium]|nr:penicillin-binding transpeptidase domain-containing protein [Bacillota bacterium]
VKEHRVNQGSRIVSENIAQKVREVMEQVTENGTGTKAGLVQYGGSGGKTGTAETGQYVNGIKVVHGWFAGYFPQNNPKYSIAVFAEDGKSGGQTAAPVFEEIAEEISRKGL